MGSARSSPDDRCDCGHDRRSHGKLMGKDACWACWENGGDDAAGAQHVHFADLMHPKDSLPQGGAGESEKCEEVHPEQDVHHPGGHPRPPQPERRQPYAVAYSIRGGHLYEVLVPGDATVVAEDGVLKIVHGVLDMDIDPVLGIMHIRPVTVRAVEKESADGVDHAPRT